MTLGESYDEFVEKFKPKKTTDDCYTPPEVYEAVLDWVVEEYGVDKNKVVRPFYLGGDYENFDYSQGAVVVDNPPFSIFKKIKHFYCERGIPFFLFSPTLTIISANDPEEICYVITNTEIVYHNKAKVNTSFVTNLDRYRLRISQDLRQRIREAQGEAKGESLPKYQYPNNVLSGGLASKYVNAGVDFKVRLDECVIVQRLDAQKPLKKRIFGRGLFLQIGKRKSCKICMKTQHGLFKLNRYGNCRTGKRK